MRLGVCLRALVSVTSACGLAVTGCNDFKIERESANQAPDTQITSGPPDRTSGISYRVQLGWRGTDPDGRVDHFDYIVVDHPAAYESTATVPVTIPGVDDPRWRSTHVAESTFVVSADTLHRDPHPGGGETPAEVLRAFFERWHTVFIRAVDERGGADPTPNYRTFNARTLAPTVALLGPVQPGSEPFRTPTSITLHWTGEDVLDKTSAVPPDSSRWVLIPSSLTRYGDFASFPDSLYQLPARFHWSPWRAWYAPDGSGLEATLRNLSPAGTAGQSGCYLFAVQAKDEAGAVTPVFDAKTPGKNNVAKLYVQSAQGPTLFLREPVLGAFVGVNGGYSIARTVVANQALRFHWYADASYYGSAVEGYRYGWDLLDPSDDSQWSGDWDFERTQLPAPRRFESGVHRFFLQARDHIGDVTTLTVELTVVPLPRTKPLLFVDDSTYPAGDPSEGLEDGRWRAVFDSLRVRDATLLDPLSDVYDVAENRGNPPRISLLFDYQAVIWSINAHSHCALRAVSYFFDPYSARNYNTPFPDDYVSTYIENGGKFWLCGEHVAFMLWPVSGCAVCDFPFVPANLTNWDDRVEPHPQVDSAGVAGFLWRMGVEAVDVGAGEEATGLRRDAALHGCLGFRRVTPAGWEVQEFTSAVAEGHTHTLIVPTQDLEAPPAAGVTLTTSTALGHAHSMTLGAAALGRLGRGETLHLSSASSAIPVTHAHDFTLVDRAAAAGGPAVLEGDPTLWPSTVCPNSCRYRATVEIYNMRGFMSAQVPPLEPSAWRAQSAYTYVSVTPANEATGMVYPRTADGQPSVILARGNPAEPRYSRVVCGFEPWRLTPRSQLRLAEYVLGYQFGLWATR